MTEKKRIGLTVFVIMTASFAVIFLSINLIFSDFIRGEAENVINDEISLDGVVDVYRENGTDMAEPSLFQLLYVVTSADYEIDYTKYGLFKDEPDVITWCKNHKEVKGEIVKTNINGHIYYLEQQSAVLKNRNKGIEILCVDVTSAEWMLRMTDIVLFLIMIICTITSTLVGHEAGKVIEEQRERQKQFFENASHELKTPLMSIRGFTEGLRNGIVPDEAHAYSVIDDEVSRMTELVDDILDLSKTEREHDVLHLEKLSVGEMLGDCLDILSPEIKKKKIKAIVEIEDRFVMADEVKLKRAIINVLSNGIRYANEKIIIKYSEHTLEISNDGRQLSEKDLMYVFDRFHTGEGGNTGIGLTLAKEILEKHGFQISVKNTNNGVCFSIDMPKQGE